MMFLLGKGPVSIARSFPGEFMTADLGFHEFFSTICKTTEMYRWNLEISNCLPFQAFHHPGPTLEVGWNHWMGRGNTFKVGL